MLKEDIPKNILLKTHYKLYKAIKPNYFGSCIIQLYNYIMNIDPKLHKHIELEVKLGTVTFEGNFKLFEHVNESFLVPSMVNDKINKVNFVSEASKHFNLIWYYINKEAEIGREMVLLKPKLYKEIIYSDKRYSFLFEDGLFKSEEIISKKNKMHLNVKYSNQLDYRISIAVEAPQQISESDIPKSYREKFRLSYKFLFFRVDFTIVKSIYNFSKRSIVLAEPNPENMKDIWAEDLGHSSTTYEIEIEFDDLYNFLVRSNYDYLQFDSIITRLLENTNMFINSVSFDTYTNFTNLTNGDTMFGNYFKYNNIN